jgi:hypothetical protein
VDHSNTFVAVVDEIDEVEEGSEKLGPTELSVLRRVWNAEDLESDQ